MKEKNYNSIITHYESCLEQHGDTHLGVDWPRAEDVATRHRVMLELIKADPSGEGRKVSLLDFGCGASHLYEYIREQNLDQIEYVGLDLSEKFIALSRSKFPEKEYLLMDVMDETTRLREFDYIVMNGVFTEKRELSFDEMFDYFSKLLRKAFASARVGLAFNVMSKHVDWERDDLFHLPFDIMAAFVQKVLTRNFVIRNDYGLFEYTVYMYR
ncbi:MAG TPA: class I SAM-dependent methyltransferase [Chthoniobacterales bacterium]